MDDIFERFTDSLYSLVPEFPLGAEEAKAQIITQGIESFVESVGSNAAELLEAVKLLTQMETVGAGYGLGGGVGFEPE